MVTALYWALTVFFAMWATLFTMGVGVASYLEGKVTDLAGGL